MARKQIGTPRFYCDIPSYLKSIGMYHGTITSGLFTPNEPNQEKVYTMNPYQPNKFRGGYNHHWAAFRFGINQSPASLSSQELIEDYELNKLLKYCNNSSGHHSSGWYAGVLGHKFASLQAELGANIHMCQRFIGSDGAGSNLYVNPNDFEEIVNYKTTAGDGHVGETGMAKYDGYSLWEITDKGNIQDRRFNILEFTNISENVTGDTENQTWADWSDKRITIGANTCGIFVEAPHSPALDVSLDLEMSGGAIYETPGGGTLVNINHTGVPNWGDIPAWKLQKTDGRDYTKVANRARRCWKVKFSYVSDDNLFDKFENSNSFYNDSFTGDAEDAYDVNNFDTSMSTFFKLTQYGSLPFIFCPDSKATITVDGFEEPNPELAICMLDQDSISCTQATYQVWNVSMNIKEIW